jgi:hypothetical protein
VSQRLRPTHWPQLDTRPWRSATSTSQGCRSACATSRSSTSLAPCDGCGAQPVARGRPVILSGATRGGEGALLIASYEPHLFDAVIASSPSAFSYGSGPRSSPLVSAWTWHGRPLPMGRRSQSAESASRC